MELDRISSRLLDTIEEAVTVSTVDPPEGMLAVFGVSESVRGSGGSAVARKTTASTLVSGPCREARADSAPSLFCPP